MEADYAQYVKDRAHLLDRSAAKLRKHAGHLLKRGKIDSAVKALTQANNLKFKAFHLRQYLYFQ